MKLRIIRLAAFVVVTGLLTVWIGQNIIGGPHGERYELAATFSTTSPACTTATT